MALPSALKHTHVRNYFHTLSRFLLGDVLCLSWSRLGVVGFGLHGVGTLRDETLPPAGGGEGGATLQAQRKRAGQTKGRDLRSLVRHRLSRQLVDLSAVFKHGQHEERLVVWKRWSC